MSHHRYFTGLIAAVFFLIAGTIQPGTANAESRLFIPDLGHSHIGFEVDHFGFSRTVGRFNRYDGEFMIDLDNQTWDRIEMTIITDSIDTNHKKRDQHLRAGDFLNVEAYPTMRFVGRNLVMHDEQTGRLEGDLTMLGVTKPVSLDLVVRKIGAVPIPSYKGATTIGIEATGVIQRSEFGMNTFLGPIGDAIYLDFHLDLVDCNPQTNSSPACQR